MKTKKLGLMILVLVFSLLVSSVGVAMQYNEAPMLKEMVDDGKIPPVEDRLPDEPNVIEVYDSIGKYGGTIKLFDPNPGELGTLQQVAEFRSMRPWKWVYDYESGKFVDEADFIKSYELSEDKEVLDIYLRKGLKWSDGEELTAEDFLFTYEHVLLNSKLHPGYAENQESELRYKMENVDDYHIKLKFYKPEPVFAQWVEIRVLPKHFFKQIHPEFIGEEKAQEQADELGLDDWVSLFEYLRYAERNTQINGNFPPSLASHVCVQADAGGWVFERNPYYYKVDEEGNQLPYVDRIRIEMVGEQEMVNGKIIDGETDWQSRFTSFADMPVYKKHAEQNNYVVEAWDAGRSCYQITFNLTPPDPGLQEVIGDKRFRQAASLTINREEINNSLYFGMLEPYAATVLPTSPYFKEEYKTSYVEYNPERAEELLKEMGCKRNEKDIWLRPDGEKLSWVHYYPTDCGGAPEAPELMEMVQRQWRDFGFDVNVKPTASEHLRQLNIAGDEIDGAGWPLDHVILDDWIVNKSRFVPSSFTHDMVEGQWGTYKKWYKSDGEEGQEPTEILKEANEMWWKARKALTFEERKKYVQKVLDINKENVWAIGVLGPKKQALVRSQRIKNVPSSLSIASGFIEYFQLYHPSQFYLEDGEPIKASDTGIYEFYPVKDRLPIVDRLKKHGWY